MDTCGFQSGQALNKPSPDILNEFLEVGPHGSQCFLLLVKGEVKGSEDVPAAILYKEDMIADPDGSSFEYTLSI